MTMVTVVKPITMHNSYGKLTIGTD